MLQSGCAYRKAGNGVSYFGAAKVFFGERPEYEHDVKETIYRPFKHALCQYEKIKHFMTHGRVTEAIVTLFEVNLEDLGFELALINPPVVRVMDACFGYKRLKKQHGSGAAFTDARIGVDGKGLLWSQECTKAVPSSLEESALSRFERVKILAQETAVLDIDKGEKLCYATTVVDDLAKRYKGSKLCISYDIACKLVAHVAKHRKKAPDTVQPDIAVLPALHAYAHNGEAIERIWSDGQANVSDTSRMRPENRRDTLALLFEYQAQRRACSFFADVTESVKKAIEDATVVAGRLRDIPTVRP
ncbi:hypothetical protein SPRG_19390 [Saprolegnia parasitica CBS 223.65]|uniref:Uncharacterized protein n=1 Tax=Saprolegnia parasitica (strain CBS 223.65) TaxID=695850 RepID=A0A067D3C7_SAPPC|nr:hypothetical protein SPRG_19390 [Saprolegnia parasitica CBS 223.65]KDO33211.1 hypothetical protein SPRG_19390 [Saprolegnia parasitica CBS 223.65]|eukprot:XP_012196270.1 hypothetical protein SPRG_19390 [Saprolegnia parasitica CBS 223.65]